MQHLLLLLAKWTQPQLARTIQFLKAENEILRRWVGNRVHAYPHEQRKLLKFGLPLGPDLKHRIHKKKAA